MAETLTLTLSLQEGRGEPMLSLLPRCVREKVRMRGPGTK